MKYTYNIGDIAEEKLDDSNDDNYDPEMRGYRKLVKCKVREECGGRTGDQGLGGMGVVILMDTIPSTSSSES